MSRRKWPTPTTARVITYPPTRGQVICAIAGALAPAAFALLAARLGMLDPTSPRPRHR
jgi:hypothetical protein